MHIHTINKPTAFLMDTIVSQMKRHVRKVLKAPEHRSFWPWFRDALLFPDMAAFNLEVLQPYCTELCFLLRFSERWCVWGLLLLELEPRTLRILGMHAASVLPPWPRDFNGGFLTDITDHI